MSWVWLPKAYLQGKCVPTREKCENPQGWVAGLGVCHPNTSSPCWKEPSSFLCAWGVQCSGERWQPAHSLQQRCRQSPSRKFAALLLLLWWFCKAEIITSQQVEHLVWEGQKNCIPCTKPAAGLQTLDFLCSLMWQHLTRNFHAWMQSSRDQTLSSLPFGSASASLARGWANSCCNAGLLGCFHPPGWALWCHGLISNRWGVWANNEPCQKVFWPLPHFEWMGLVKRQKVVQHNLQISQLQAHVQKQLLLEL